MKKTVSLILSSVMLLTLLCACSGNDGGGTAAEPAMSDVTAAVSGAVKLDNMAALDSKYVDGKFSFGEGAVSESAVYISNVGTSIDEYGVFKAADADSAKAIEETVKAYIQNRIDTWMGYTPEELPKLENAGVWTNGSYVVYAILSDDARDAAHTAFTGCFKG